MLQRARNIKSAGEAYRAWAKERLTALLACLVLAVNLTLRYRIQVPLPTKRLFRTGKPFLLAFRHGRILLLPFLYRSEFPGGRHLLTLTGEHWSEGWVTGIVARLGLAPFRMSSLRGGQRSLERTILGLRPGDAVAVAADGPRGPGRHIDPGILDLAWRTKVPIVPVSWSARPRWRTGTWERLHVPLPFARVHAAFGEPLYVNGEEHSVWMEQGRPILARRLSLLAAQTDAQTREARIGGWIFWGYTVSLFVVSLLILPWLLWKIVSVRNRRTGFAGRMGLTGLSRKGQASRERPLWIHTVSVGEVLSIVPFVRRLKELRPDLPLVISSITPAGRAMAREVFREGERVICFPFDVPFPVWKAVRAIRPSLFLHTESEIWPYFLLVLGRQGIPSAILNGRLSAGSCKRFGWFRFFLKRVLASVHVFAMQSRADCCRIIRIGADPSRVFLTGNMKFDVPEPQDAGENRKALREEMGFGEESLVLAAGSTHEGEEEILIGVCAQIKNQVPNLKLLLAPRHPERCGDVERMCRKEQLSCVRRTRRADAKGPDGADVLLLDTMGELGRSYAAADVVFVGGTLVPIGGHNPLEPILYKKPVLFGPHTEKIADTVRALRETGGGIPLGGREDLLRETGRLLMDPVFREAAGRSAYGILERNRGAVERNLAILRPLLYPDGMAGGGSA